MRWNVEVADAATGQERIVQIDAGSALDAERIARRKGLLVSAVHPSTVKTPAEALDEMVGKSIASPAAAPASLPPPDPKPLGYAGLPPVSASALTVPAYQGLAIGAAILMAFAIFSYLGGMIWLTLALFGLAASAYARSGPAGTLAVMVTIPPAIGCLLGGALLHTLSAAASALRDIARNSFR